MTDETKYEVTSVADLIARVLQGPRGVRLWFRGQGCSTHKLAPSLVRRMHEHGGSATVAQMLELEKRLITRFRQRSLPFWPEGYPQSDWEHLFAMQHHGVPTRLLDWSTNLLIATFFALDHDSDSCPCEADKCTPSVWVLNPERLNRSNPRLDGIPVEVLATSDQDLIKHWEPGTPDNLLPLQPIALHGTYNSQRIFAQSGQFTVAGASMQPLAVEDDVLWRFNLTGDPEKARDHLKTLGISRVAVYPGLPGLAHDISLEEIR